MILYFGYNISFKYIDRGLLELIGPLGLIKIGKKLTIIISKLESGFIYHYALIMTIGLISILLLLFLPFYLKSGLLITIYYLYIYILWE